MKVVSVIGSLGVRNGGPGINLVSSVPYLRAVGVDVEVVTTDMATPSAFKGFRRLEPSDLPPGSDQARIAVTKSIPPHRVNFSPGMHRALARRLEQADLLRIHGLYLYPHFVAQQTARRLGVPYVVSPHGLLDPYIRTRSPRAKKAMDRLWQRQTIEGAAAIHATTADEAQHILDAFPGVEVTVVPNGLALDSFAGASGGDTFRQQWFGGWTGPIVTTLGRLSHKKGLDILVAAFAMVLSDHDARLAVVGPDDEGLTAELQAQARQLGVEDRIAFTGPVYGAARGAALDATTVWALPSRGENFGNAIAEAMAAGCPVVVSPEVGIAPVIEAADAGTITLATPTATAGAISAFLRDPELTRATGARAQAAAATYDWNVVAPQFRDLYEQAIRGKDRA